MKALKMKNQIVIFLLIVLFATISCNLSRKSAAKAPYLKTVQPLTIEKISYEEIVSDPFTIDTAYTVSDTIAIAINYGGGCGTYEATLYYNDIVALSMPPQLSMKLAFVDNDLCRAIIHDTLYFDLSELESITGESGGAIIRLQNYEYAIKYKI